MEKKGGEKADIENSLPNQDGSCSVARMAPFAA